MLAIPHGDDSVFLKEVDHLCLNYSATADCKDILVQSVYKSFEADKEETSSEKDSFSEDDETWETMDDETLSFRKDLRCKTWKEIEYGEGEEFILDGEEEEDIVDGITMWQQDWSNLTHRQEDNAKDQFSNMIATSLEENIKDEAKENNEYNSISQSDGKYRTWF